MKIDKFVFKSAGFPEVLRHIPDPPKKLRVAGVPLGELLSMPTVGIVGSRKVSPYGREVTAKLSRQLAERGVVIVSGLAFGVDSIAHQGALDGGGQTIAVLPGSIEKIYPASHNQLAGQIIKHGGTLISEYDEGVDVMHHNFIERNRLIAGLSKVLLVTEAALKSGSLHTARFALEQGKDVLAVPGNITSQTSEGTNNLIKAGAGLVNSYADVLHALGLEEKQAKKLKPCGRNEQEQTLLNLIAQGVGDGEELQKQSGLDIKLFNQTLTMLEIGGHVRAIGGNQWVLIII
jgi:DNA processing protein